MRKKIYIGENNLLKMKKAMANEKVSHSHSIANSKPPYEKDEFVIGGEGGNNDFFHINENVSDEQLKTAMSLRPNKFSNWVVILGNHYKFFEKKSLAIEYKRWLKMPNAIIVNLNKIGINEGYCFSKLKDVDLSTVGMIECEDDFVEEYYEEWLTENNLTDSEEVREQYYTDEVNYDVSYYDNQTLHYMDGDQMVMYSDLEELFGEDMAKKIKFGCMKNGEYKFETFELYENANYDINNPQELNEIAMKLFRHGEYYKDCRGFILTNGVVVYTEAEHNEICLIPGIESKFQFIELGNIRLLPNSIDIGAEPTSQQWDVLKEMLMEYEGEEIYLDIFHNGQEFGAAYNSSNSDFVLAEINRFYSEGIRPGSMNVYESTEHTFENWFGKSILTDENGQPIKMYHGTDDTFNEFSKEHIGGHGSFEGYGFNFTPFESRARSYSSKNVIEAYLRVENPMTTKSNKITLPQLVKIIASIDEGKPFTDTIVAAYEPARYNEKWDEKYYRRALPVAAKTIYNYNKECEYGDAGIYAEICLNGNGGVEKTIETFEKLGYDSAIFYDNSGGLNTVVVFEPNQIKRTSNKTFNNSSNVMDENLETEVEADDINLNSFKKQNTLAPKIWKDKKINARVRLKLLDIADDFWDFTNITWVKKKGIYLTGSICNYNWSKYSDIDLHIVADFSEIDERKDFVQEYFDSKKNEWNQTHSKLKIYGFPVELYVEDINAETTSGGLYDLENNSWVRLPNEENIKPLGLNKYEIKNKAAKIMTAIDDLYEEFKTTDDEAVLNEIGKKAHKLLSKIKRMRKFGLERGGESDELNVIYKVLRRSEYMDKLWELSSELYDKINSIGPNETEVFEIAKRYIEKNKLNEEVVADGNAEHNPFAKKWKYEADILKNYLTNYGEIMTSKENGKEYKVLYDPSLSSKLGINYCICILWNSLTMEPGNVIYVRSYDKFTKRRFQAQFDTRGKDNLQGTSDDLTQY